MTDQRFGFAPLSPFGSLPGAAGGPYGGDLGAAVATLLGRMQGQTAPAPGSLTGPLGGADDERRAGELFLRDVTAASLRKLYRYLESAAPRHADLAASYQPFQQAVRAYRGRDYAQALTGCYQVYRMIVALQARHPDLPELADEPPAPAPGEHHPHGSARAA
jgi:hypothetical protein